MAEPSTTGAAAERRRYDSPVRRQQVAETRERILGAASALVHELPTWDWRALTFRAVAERAGVSERTVYRHFATERELNDSVMRRLEQEAGVSYEGVDLEHLTDVAALVFSSLSSFAVAPLGVDDPTFAEEDRLRRDALRAAVAAPAGANGWSDVERDKAAGVLDVLWNVSSFERLVVHWGLAADDATGAIAWAIGLVVDAIRDGSPPR